MHEWCFGYPSNTIGMLTFMLTIRDCDCEIFFFLYFYFGQVCCFTIVLLSSKEKFTVTVHYERQSNAIIDEIPEPSTFTQFITLHTYEENTFIITIGNSASMINCFNPAHFCHRNFNTPFTFNDLTY